MTRGQDGSLSLACVTFTFTTPRRFIPAHSRFPPHLPPTHPTSQGRGGLGCSGFQKHKGEHCGQRVKDGTRDRPRHQPRYRPMIPKSARTEFWPTTTKSPRRVGACKLCSQGAQRGISNDGGGVKSVFFCFFALLAHTHVYAQLCPFARRMVRRRLICIPVHPTRSGPVSLHQPGVAHQPSLRPLRTIDE